MNLFVKTKASAQEAPETLGGRLVSMLRGSDRAAVRALRHVETLSLGPKRSLFLVECDGERFLVAAGADGLSAPVAVATGRPVRQQP